MFFLWTSTRVEIQKKPFKLRPLIIGQKLRRLNVACQFLFPLLQIPFPPYPLADKNVSPFESEIHFSLPVRLQLKMTEILRNTY